MRSGSLSSPRIRATGPTALCSSAGVLARVDGVPGATTAVALAAASGLDLDLRAR